MAFQRNKGTYAGKWQCSTCPKVDLSRWRGALDAISSAALSAEWMPIFVTLSFIQSILSMTSLYQVLLSALGMLQRMRFQKWGSRTWCREDSPQPLGNDGSVHLIIFPAAIFSFSTSGPHAPLGCHQSLYWRLQSRLLCPGKLPGPSAAFSGWCSDSLLSASLCPVPLALWPHWTPSHRASLLSLYLECPWPHFPSSVV